MGIWKDIILFSIGVLAGAIVTFVIIMTGGDGDGAILHKGRCGGKGEVDA